MRNSVVLGALVLAGCGAPAPEPDPVEETVPAAFVGEPEALGGGGQHTALVADGATPDSLRAAAQAFCNGKQWCQVMAWREDANRPKAMPMVARESESIAFNYLINRSSGHEAAQWDCRVWQGPRDNCLEGTRRISEKDVLPKEENPEANLTPMGAE